MAFNFTQIEPLQIDPSVYKFWTEADAAVAAGEVNLDRFPPKYFVVEYHKTWNEFDVAGCGTAYETFSDACDAARALAKAMPGNVYFVACLDKRFEASVPMVTESLVF